MLDICYEDDDIIIVNKPPHLLCVPGLSDPDNLHQRVLKRNANARVVHRLDMATSGLVIFALNYESQKRMSKLFELREIHKHYIADVAGVINHEKGEIVSPIICDWPQRPKQKIDWLNGKLGHTHFEVIQRHSSDKTSSTRVKLTPITGRTHQLRIHMEQIGHPILGDQLYHHPGINDNKARLHLHARALEFEHPFNQKPVSVFCEADF